MGEPILPLIMLVQFLEEKFEPKKRKISKTQLKKKKDLNKKCRKYGPTTAHNFLLFILPLTRVPY
jgi:hypothetical protein